MLVHFIGGPAHGRSEAIFNPPPVWRWAELKARVHFAVGEFEELNAEIPFEEHQYRVTKRTPRYAIAEWEAPTVQVRFVVEVEVDPFDHAATTLLQKYIMERRMDQDGDVKCIGADVYCAEKATLTLAALVEGPEDPIAIQLAAEKVQHYLDANLPPSRQRIQHTAAEV
jgi:hypothetical protein